MMAGTITGKEAEEFRRQYEQEQRELRAFAETHDAFPHIPQLQQFGHGAIKNLDRVYMGAKDLVTDLSPEDRVRMARYEAMDTPAATVGEIGTDIATLAAPGGAAAKVAQKVVQGGSRLKKALAALGAETGLTAGYEGLKLPEAGQTRTGNAATAALWQAGLGSIGPLARARNASKITPEGRAMLNQGVPLTPGMARDDWTTRSEERRVGKEGRSRWSPSH